MKGKKEGGEIKGREGRKRGKGEKERGKKKKRREREKKKQSSTAGIEPATFHSVANRLWLPCLEARFARTYYRGLQVACQVAKCKFKVMIAK